MCHTHFHDHQQYNFLVQKSSICPLISLTGPFEVFAVVIDRNGPPPGLCEQLCKMFIFLGLALDLLSSVGDFYTQVVVKTRPEYLTLNFIFV